MGGIKSEERKKIAQREKQNRSVCASISKRYEQNLCDSESHHKFHRSPHKHLKHCKLVRSKCVQYINDIGNEDYEKEKPSLNQTNWFSHNNPIPKQQSDHEFRSNSLNYSFRLQNFNNRCLIESKPCIIIIINNNKKQLRRICNAVQ